MVTRRRFAILGLGLPALLAGCGWQPVLADPETAPAAAELRAIRVNPISERVGQQLAMGLRNSFNPTHEPTKELYALQVTMNTQMSDLGIQSQGLGTRGEVHIYTTYRLTDITTGKMLQTNTIHTTDSFDIQANGYSTVVAEDDAFVRCVEETRREIVTRLTLFLQNQKAAS